MNWMNRWVIAGYRCAGVAVMLAKIHREYQRAARGFNAEISQTVAGMFTLSK
jgi:hypothetical protein